MYFESKANMNVMLIWKILYIKQIFTLVYFLFLFYLIRNITLKYLHRSTYDYDPVSLSEAVQSRILSACQHYYSRQCGATKL